MTAQAQVAERLRELSEVWRARDRVDDRSTSYEDLYCDGRAAGLGIAAAMVEQAIRDEAAKPRIVQLDVDEDTQKRIRHLQSALDEAVRDRDEMRAELDTARSVVRSRDAEVVALIAELRAVEAQRDRLLHVIEGVTGSLRHVSQVVEGGES